MKVVAGIDVGKRELVVGCRAVGARRFASQAEGMLACASTG